MTMHAKRLGTAVAAAGGLVLFGVGCNPPLSFSSSPDPVPSFVASSTATTPDSPPTTPVTVHIPLPEEVRGIYWTADTAIGPKSDELLAYMKRYGLNTAVVDLKMDDGTVVLDRLAPVLKKLADAGIYRIARLQIMKDPAFAAAHPEVALRSKKGGVWRDFKGTTWVDPGASIVTDTVLALSREAYTMGFDEIQFDYIRFPSDGHLTDIVYPFSSGTSTKHAIMRKLFDTLGSLRQKGIPISYDLFGMTFISTDDYGIGQRLPDAWPNGDFVSPMVYPSHYASGFQGFPNPALAPYEVVKYSLDKGVETVRLEFPLETPSSTRPKFRPWLQDFDIGATYTAARIEAQIKAARDAGASGWMLWNARNVYEPAHYTP
jgi:hypothetical protein